MIENILKYINEYYHVFILIILIGAFILSLFRKTTKSDFVRVFDMVNKAEELFPEPGSGAVKLAYVISQLKDIDPNTVIKLVDEVLSSPEKK